jgi:hypothetical protein
MSWREHHVASSPIQMTTTTAVISESQSRVDLSRSILFGEVACVNTGGRWGPPLLGEERIKIPTSGLPSFAALLRWLCDAGSAIISTWLLQPSP